MSQVANSSSLGSGSNTTIQRKGNVASFNNSNTDGLSAIDTYGNTFEVPDYSIKDILNAIPKHCYNRSLPLSLYYVFRDIAIVAASAYIAHNYVPLLPNQYLRFFAYAGYCYWQGLVSTGLWVLAHECGHQAFSDYGVVNDFVGWVLHSYLLVPYFSWKYSHSMHHKSTGNLSRDMVFVPKTKEEFLTRNNAKSLDDILEDSPIYTLYSLIVQQLFGWLAYITTNVTGQRLHDIPAFRKNHFNPNSVLYDKKAYWYILLSDLGIGIQLFLVYTAYNKFGGFNVLIHWFIPYIFVNHWLVFITFLQHSDPKLPHYEADQWNFARGAATTIDREFGFVGQHLFHDIIETHVLHHYVSRIPFYNARDATKAIKEVMGDHYRYDGSSMWKALWDCSRACQFVDDEDVDGVMMFRNVNGVGVKPSD